MPDQIFNQARLTGKRKALKILEIIGYFIFVVAAMVVYSQISALVFWVTILLFGTGGVVALRELLKPKSALDDQKLATRIRDKQNELGNFSYDAQGFTAPGTKGKVYCRWTDIEVLFAHKVVYIEERFASEDTTLDILTQDQQRIPLSTYVPGWPQFRIRLQQNLPETPLNWVETIALPAMYPNPTLLFDRRGRSQAEIEKLYYSDGFAVKGS